LPVTVMRTKSIRGRRLAGGTSAALRRSACVRPVRLSAAGFEATFSDRRFSPTVIVTP
jgi:hypothetical protein